MSDEFPPMIGKYKVLGIVAKGGMGVVYKAIHPSLKRYIVIKKMTSKRNTTNAERFKKEAQILLDLQSPYIVHLFDYFTEGSYRYMVEELVDGLALDKLIAKQTSLPVPIAMLVLQDACYALKYAHSKDIVHRDIKPGNILISKRGEVKLADFGIASDAEEDSLTQSGTALGTPAYMPPEQFEDSAHVDNRADIYALGIMLYEMLTGTKPYPGTFSMENLKVIKKGRYIRPRKIDHAIPEDVSKLIHKMIRPNKRRRFQSIDGVLRAVKKYLSHYDTHEIRVQLAKSLFTAKLYEFPKFEPKDKAARIFRTIAASVILLCALGLAGWRSGFFYQTILSRWYTPVTVEMVMPKALAENLDLPARAFFFENKDGIPEVKDTDRTFALKGSRFFERLFDFSTKFQTIPSTIKNNTYDIPKVYLKAGDYRVKVAVGPYVWWKSFSVKDKAITLDCSFLKNANRELTILPYVYDGKSGEEITDSSKIMVFYFGKWINLFSVPKEDLKSGTVWKLRVECEGYEPEIFSLLIDWYQDRLFISSELKPLN
ncbi:MAG: serine/threonine protein kinase [Treponema sp.]|nr:serine/threonine protein kinase [Treponema sp.]